MSEFYYCGYCIHRVNGVCDLLDRHVDDLDTPCDHYEADEELIMEELHIKHD